MTETPASYGEAGAAERWELEEHNISSDRSNPMPVYQVIGPEYAFPNMVPGMLIHNKEHACAIAAAPELLAELKAYHGAAEDAWLSLCEMPRTEENQRLIESGRKNLDKTAALIRRAKGETT